MSGRLEIPYFQINSFTDQPFKGNPAGVCPLTNWLDDKTMMNLAEENKVSETAFFVSEAWDGFQLRWFTPTIEVDLCGHATLATGYVILNFLRPDDDRVEFNSRAGKLAVERGENGMMTLDFPAYPPDTLEITPDFEALFGKKPLEVLASGMNLLVVFEGSDQDILDLVPNYDVMAKFPEYGFIATAKGETCDFVSRYFAPNHGIEEDPVTGSAHCTSGPYWAEKLGKTEMHARQISARGGDLYLKLEGDRIKISGHCFLVLEGAINLS